MGGRSAQAAEAAAESFRDEMDDSGGAAGRFRVQIKKTSESAQDMGTSFKGAMADGLDAGQSIAKSFRSGVTGAMDFTKKRQKFSPTTWSEMQKTSARHSSTL